MMTDTDTAESDISMDNPQQAYNEAVDSLAKYIDPSPEARELIADRLYALMKTEDIDGMITFSDRDVTTVLLVELGIRAELLARMVDRTMARVTLLGSDWSKAIGEWTDLDDDDFDLMDDDDDSEEEEAAMRAATEAAFAEMDKDPLEEFVRDDEGRYAVFSDREMSDLAAVLVDKGMDAIAVDGFGRTVHVKDMSVFVLSDQDLEDLAKLEKARKLAGPSTAVAPSGDPVSLAAYLGPGFSLTSAGARVMVSSVTKFRDRAAMYSCADAINMDVGIVGPEVIGAPPAVLTVWVYNESTLSWALIGSGPATSTSGGATMAPAGSKLPAAGGVTMAVSLDGTEEALADDDVWGGDPEPEPEPEPDYEDEDDEDEDEDGMIVFEGDEGEDLEESFYS